MNEEAKQDVPAGKVRNLTTQWELNAPHIDDVNTNTQTPVTANRSRGVKPRKPIPQLHNNFFKEILSRMHGELEAVGFTVKQEREGGPNQTSNITTVQVLTADHSHINFILKSINSSPEAKVLKFKELFKKEALMYTTIIPSLITMHPDHPLTMFSRSYHTSNDLLVLDDLASHGYRIGDHKVGLDAAHCKLVFAELGRFHAATYVLKNSDSTDISSALNEACRELQFTKERSSIYDEHFAQLARNTVDIIRKSQETSRYAKRIEDILKNTYQHLLTFLKPKEPFSTLTHGELWTNNIMFNYSNDEPVSVKFLDFQTCRYGSPALDINYFLYTSTTAWVRERHMDEFMRTYHRSLVGTLRQSGLKSTMDLTELRREVNSMAMYGFLAAHLNLRNTFYDPDVSGDADNLFSKRITEIVTDLGEQGLL